MTLPRIVTRPLAGPPVVRAALAGAVPDGWYARLPAAPAAWGQAMVEAVASVPRGWLDALRPALAGSGAGVERLVHAAAVGGAVVTTGQQPGLFGGPIYTWSKALSALALADALQRSTGRPVAPVFWAATDDADYDEARVTYVARVGGLEMLQLPPNPTPGRSLREIPVGDAGALIQRLAEGAGSLAHAWPLQLAAQAYAPGCTVGSAYVALLRAVLEPLGIAVLDAGHPAVRAAMSPLLRRALDVAPALEQALAARDAELTASGFTPQVRAVAGMSLVMETTVAGRVRVPLARASAARAAAAEALGPNVLLRPVAERTVLPSVAYVAGPGELAYFAQVSAVAAALGQRTPLAVPRWSGLIIEPHIERLLERLALTPDELAVPHAAETRLARARTPSGVGEALAEARASMRQAVQAIERAAVDDAALVPRTVVQGVERAIAHRFARLERRLTAAVKRRDVALQREVATVRAALAPNGAPQERRLNLLPLLARAGPALLEQMLAAAARQMGGLADGRAPVGEAESAPAAALRLGAATEP